MKKSRGFTLVEMLIVIAVIGVLAVAVLSAINPVEQMRKARDTRRRSNAAELLNALERFYATNEHYPSSYTVLTADTVNCGAVMSNSEIGSGQLSGLMTANEVKAEFLQRITDSANYLYGAIQTGTELAVVCYQIESNANKDKYSTAGNHCTASGNEYVCLPE